MTFTSEQLSSGRWGIYQDSRLLATVGCPITLGQIHARLDSTYSPVISIKDASTLPKTLQWAAVNAPGPRSYK